VHAYLWGVQLNAFSEPSVLIIVACLVTDVYNSYAQYSVDTEVAALHAIRGNQCSWCELCIIAVSNRCCSTQQTLERIQKSGFTLRDLQQQLQISNKMGPFSKVIYSSYA
jgi:Tfp pilus assembly protein PilE